MGKHCPPTTSPNLAAVSSVVRGCPLPGYRRTQSGEARATPESGQVALDQINAARQIYYPVFTKLIGVGGSLFNSA